MICGQEYGGMGLDLSISKHLVYPMNGNESMEKHVRRDKGTMLSVTTQHIPVDLLAPSDPFPPMSDAFWHL